MVMSMSPGSFKVNLLLYMYLYNTIPITRFDLLLNVLNICASMRSVAIGNSL